MNDELWKLIQTLNEYLIKKDVVINRINELNESMDEWTHKWIMNFENEFKSLVNIW